jgi:hypothetical protein
MPIFGFIAGSQLVKSTNCKISFSIPDDWKVEDLKSELFEFDEEDEAFKSMEKQYKKMLNGFDVFESTSAQKIDKRIIAFFIYKDNTLNLNEVDYYGIKFQGSGNGQKMSLNGIEWTSIIKDYKPSDKSNYNIYQLTARIKKVNVLIFAQYPISMDEHMEDLEIKGILKSFGYY